MKILYLSHRIPYPPNKGDKIRSFNEIKYLSKSHEIHLACLADDPDDFRHEDTLRRFCPKVHVAPLDTMAAKVRGIKGLIFGKSLSGAYFYSNKLQRVIDDFLSSTRYDAIICFSSVMAEYLFKSTHSRFLFDSKECKTRFVMDFCDVDSDKWLQYSKNARFPIKLLYRLEYGRLLEYEKRINRFFHCSVFVTSQESELFLRLCPDAANVFTVSNGVDFDFFSPSASIEKVFKEGPSGPVLLFTGAMDYHANIDGVVWFSDHVFPTIKERYPDAVFFIVGSKPDRDVLDLGRRDGVEVTGFVDDIRPYYDAADVCVIPLRMARGIQNKVLEALAMAKPVVATSKASEGIKAVPGEHLLVENESKRFANAVLGALDNSDVRETLGRKGRNFVLENYDWKKNMKSLETLLE